MANELLLVNNINSYYNTIHALYDVSFHVDEGEIVTLIGANGAGKSTTLKTISGLMRTQTGGIIFDGKDITKYPAYKIAEIGLAHVPEGRRVFSHLTVLENLEMGAYTQPKNELSDALEKVYFLFPRLKERMKQVAGTLSGGEQQMLAMGRALMSKPKLMMLDEPSMGLSPILVQEVFDIIKDLHNEGTTILLVEQNAQMALSIADRGYVLESGKIVIEDSADRLANNNLVKKAYLGG
jgi:branched-chain amino acid transport system ATP-binding protein